MDQAKTETISNLESPKNVADIQSFMSLAGYYRRFLKDFSKIAKSLTSLMRKENRFVWSAECEEAFQTLKKCVQHLQYLD